MKTGSEEPTKIRDHAEWEMDKNTSAKAEAFTPKNTPETNPRLTEG